MRHTIQRQLSLVEPSISHQHAKELQGIQMIFDMAPEIILLAQKDLTRNKNLLKGGRPAVLTAEQVIKSLIIKQMNSYSYRMLEFHLQDSRSYRAFCGFGFCDKIPTHSTLQRDLSSIRPQTLEKINQYILDIANMEGFETGRTVRFDATNVASNIHKPSDSSLLADSVRVLCRITQLAKKPYGMKISDHRRAAKKHSLCISNARNAKQRKKHYRILLDLTRTVIKEAESAALALWELKGDLVAKAYANEITTTIPLAETVLRQTEARVFREESLPPSEKIVSIFESHTDILKKTRRETKYGHKATFGCGKSGLITDVVIEDGNPADSTLALRMVQRQKKIYGQVPREVAFDGGYTSRANLKAIKDEGVKNVCFHKKRGIEITDMVSSLWTFKRLRNFRAGIEGMISYLKRCFGLDRCTWKGLEHFHSYVWASVVSANALLLGRMLIC